MTVPSTWTTTSSRPADVMLAPVPPRARARLDEMADGLKEVSPGRYTISRAVALTDDERRWVEGRLEAVRDSLTVGTPEAIEDRLHGFAYGFSQLRSLDEKTFSGVLKNWLQAVDDRPLQAVAMACEAWNKNRFKWANPSFPPQAPELAKAVTETWCAMRMEERELRIALSAEPVTVLPAPKSEDARKKAIDHFNEVMAEIVEGASMQGASVAGSANDVDRQAALDDLKRREERRKTEAEA